MSVGSSFLFYFFNLVMLPRTSIVLLGLGLLLSYLLRTIYIERGREDRSTCKYTRNDAMNSLIIKIA